MRSRAELAAWINFLVATLKLAVHCDGGGGG